MSVVGAEALEYYFSYIDAANTPQEQLSVVNGLSKKSDPAAKLAAAEYAGLIIQADNKESLQILTNIALDGEAAQHMVSTIEGEIGVHELALDKQTMMFNALTTAWWLRRQGLFERFEDRFGHSPRLH